MVCSDQKQNNSSMALGSTLLACAYLSFTSFLVLQSSSSSYSILGKTKHKFEKSLANVLTEWLCWPKLTSKSKSLCSLCTCVAPVTQRKQERERERERERRKKSHLAMWYLAKVGHTQCPKCLMTPKESRWHASLKASSKQMVLTHEKGRSAPASLCEENPFICWVWDRGSCGAYCIGGCGDGVTEGMRQKDGGKSALPLEWKFKPSNSGYWKALSWNFEYLKVWTYRKSWLQLATLAQAK